MTCETEITVIRRTYDGEGNETEREIAVHVEGECCPGAVFVCATDAATGDVVELDRLEIAWAEEQMDADMAARRVA